MLTATLLVAGLVQAVSIVVEEPAPAAAADLSQFNPGRIIDDSLFFNGTALSAPQVQSFLASMVPRCQAGYTCMKDFRQATTNKPADAMCAGYTGMPYESAADIIAKVGQSCGISQKVLLVTLQKEQGLVTHTWPSDWRYTIAMGQGCPDTQACDVAYYGFFNQVYGAARQFKRYANPPGTSNFFTWYAPGKTWNVRYHPNEACGSSPVYIQNQATANLYYYTPYQPNAAALAAGYGEGNGCSAYGNRNFYQWYVDWFGSTRGYDVGSYFADYFNANRAWLGYTMGPMQCGLSNGGCSQQFQGGWVYSSAGSYVRGVRNELMPTWSNYGRQNGELGYPILDKRCDDMTPGVCRQEFQGGWIVSSAATGNRVVPSDIQAVWSNWGRDFGAMGLPLFDRGCDAAKCVQQFQSAWVVKNARIGVRVVPNAVYATWSNWGREAGILGFPTGDPTVPGGANYTQTFQGGTVTVTNNVGAVTATSDPWFAAVLSSPWLGASSGDRSCSLKDGGCYQPFAGGWVLRSSAGAYAVPSAVLQTWFNWGREWGILGFPTGPPSANPATGNYTQTFQGGTVTVTNNVGAVTATSDPWFAAVLSSPWLGASSGDRSCSLKDGGCYQPFAGGWVLRSSAGAYAVPSAVLQTWFNWGREWGILGFPTGPPSANPATGNYTQTFQGGTVTVTNNVGAVTATSDPWFAAVLSSPWLGASSGDRSCSLKDGGCYQPFAGGWVVRSSAGAYAVPSAVLQTWFNWGREWGILGFPTGPPSANPATGNYTQTFQGGTITVTNGVGRF